MVDKFDFQTCLIKKSLLNLKTHRLWKKKMDVDDVEYVPKPGRSVDTNELFYHELQVDVMDIYNQKRPFDGILKLELDQEEEVLKIALKLLRSAPTFLAFIDQPELSSKLSELYIKLHEKLAPFFLSSNKVLDYTVDASVGRVVYYAHTVEMSDLQKMYKSYHDLIVQKVDELNFVESMVQAYRKLKKKVAGQEGYYHARMYDHGTELNIKQPDPSVDFLFARGKFLYLRDMERNYRNGWKYVSSFKLSAQSKLDVHVNMFLRNPSLTIELRGEQQPGQEQGMVYTVNLNGMVTNLSVCEVKRVSLHYRELGDYMKMEVLSLSFDEGNFQVPLLAIPTRNELEYKLYNPLSLLLPKENERNRRIVAIGADSAGFATIDNAGLLRIYRFYTTNSDESGMEEVSEVEEFLEFSLRDVLQRSLEDPSNGIDCFVYKSTNSNNHSLLITDKKGNVWAVSISRNDNGPRQFNVNISHKDPEPRTMIKFMPYAVRDNEGAFFLTIYRKFDGIERPVIVQCAFSEYIDWMFSQELTEIIPSLTTAKSLNFEKAGYPAPERHKDIVLSQNGRTLMTATPEGDRVLFWRIPKLDGLPAILETSLQFLLPVISMSFVNEDENAVFFTSDGLTKIIVAREIEKNQVFPHKIKSQHSSTLELSTAVSQCDEVYFWSI